MGSKCSKCSEHSQSKKKEESPSIISLQNHNETIKKDSFFQASVDDSLLTLEKMMNKYPENPELLVKIAVHLYEKGLLSQSLDCFSRIESQDFTFDSQASFVFAQIQVQYKNYEKAIEILSKSIENNPSDHKSHAFLGEIYSELELPELSLQHITEALKLQDGIAEYHNSFGLCMMKEKQYTEALSHFLKAFELDRTMAKSLNNAGNAYRKLGNTSDAIKCYNTAINLIPKRKFPIALINLATACFYTGDIISTLTYFEEALQTGSNIHKIMVKKGYHLFFKSPKTKYAIELVYKQDYYKSIQILNDILKSDPNNPVLHFYMAIALSKLSKTSEANESFKATIENGSKPIFANKQFVKHYVKRARKAMKKIVSKQPCEEIPEVDEDSENSTINIGSLQVFKVRAESLTTPYQPRTIPSPCDSPLDTSIDETGEKCIVM